MADGLTHVRQWWSQKYSRPATDPAFERQTYAELHLEMLEDLHLRRKGLLRDLEDRPADFKAVEELQQLNKALGIEGEVSSDPLIDKWERELAAGRIPDLDER